MNPLLCPGSVPSFINFFDFTIAPQLLFYTYIPVIIISLLLGVFIWEEDKHSLVSTLFFAMSVFFSLWVLDMIILWIGAYNSSIMFFWQITPIFEILMYIFTVYFALVMSNKEKKDIGPKLKLLFIGIMFAVFAFLPTHLNIINYNMDICEGTPGIFFYSMYVAEVITIILLAIVFIKRFISIPKGDAFRKEILYIGISIISFLLLFTGTNLIGQITSIQLISLLDSLGMVIFLGILVYLIVRFKAFNVKLFATQALVWVLIVLIGSQFFFIKVIINFILTGITFVGVVIIGQFLIKSVKREIEQRELLESLTLKLEQSNSDLGDANEKLKGLDKLKTEFVSLASHQLRSPLTAIKGYLSMVLEGDYGEINPEAKAAVTRASESSNNLTLVVEDLLNVSKIESGGMKYEMTKFDFGELARKTAEELSITAEKKGLKLVSEINVEQKYFVNGDKEKLRQVLINLIDNSMKYTENGQIAVSIKNENQKNILMVKDTGVGIEAGREEALFDKFSRGEGGKLNSSGSGLGLYLVREIAKAHNGRAWAESEGVGKGSTFFVELEEAK